MDYTHIVFIKKSIEIKFKTINEQIRNLVQNCT